MILSLYPERAPRLTVVDFAAQRDASARIQALESEIAELRLEVAELRLAMIDEGEANRILRQQKRRLERRLAYIVTGRES